MVIGNGLVANIFKKFENDNSVLFFASGVSNSSEANNNEFEREKILLEKKLIKYKNIQFIYFSTCSIYDTSLENSKYIEHKLNMEKLIMDNHLNFLILRLSNIVGEKGNQNTLINFLVDSIKHNEPFNIWENSYRNLIDQNDVYQIVCNIKSMFTNTTLNIASPVSFPIQDIVKQVEIFLQKKGDKTMLKKGAKFKIDISNIKSEIESIIKEPSINYVMNLLKKYY